MHSKLLSLLITFSCFTPLQAQTAFNWGPSLGYSTSGFNTSASETDVFDNTTQTTKPTKSILIGIQAQVIWHQHWNILSGVRYQSIGLTQEWIREGKMFVSESSMANYITTNKTSHSYQKLALPIAFGYQFNLGHIKPNIYLGYVQNFLMAANFVETTVTNCEVDEYDTFYYESQKPLKTDIPVNHFNSQLQAGVSIILHNHLMLQANANFGGYLYFAENTPAYCVLNGNSMRNNDYTLSLSYLF